MESEDEMIPIALAAKRAKVPVRTLYRAASEGYLWTKPFGPKALMTTEKAVKEWLETPEYHTPKKGQKPPRKY